MPYRIFEDSTGTEWQVWDIVPRLSERRLGESDRRVETQVIRFADRRHAPRRMTQVRRGVLRGSYALGWLCFDNGAQKRRLSPIPGDWTVCDEDVMEAYLQDADVVPITRSYNRLSDEDLAQAG